TEASHSSDGSTLKLALMGGTPLRRARSRAQGAALVKNKVYKYWFKSRLKDRLAVAEKRAETLANAGFSACGQPLKCQ
ncbi:TPA: hypothetical protein ACULEK_004729, partial [Escherichia coli]|uniref:hypothetical protein n=2 Tax=Escherichia coli TaxID=562 RepID=UPI003D9A0C78